jgi:hypothetical protein
MTEQDAFPASALACSGGAAVRVCVARSHGFKITVQPTAFRIGGLISKGTMHEVMPSEVSGEWRCKAGDENRLIFEYFPPAFPTLTIITNATCIESV